MPKGLDIDHEANMKGSVTFYTEHVLVHTGTNDWLSRIENDDRFPFMKQLKKLQREEALKPRDNSSQPNAILASNSSFPSTAPGKQVVSVLRAGHHVLVPRSGPEMLFEALSSRSFSALETVEITEICILICGHGERDARCGILGPLLVREFESKLKWNGLRVLGPDVLGDKLEANEIGVRVGLISHIGGHKYAGNVIVYVPKAEKFMGHALSGKGVWYGRVEPRHVQGIIEETVTKGVIIDELLRGVV